MCSRFAPHERLLTLACTTVAVIGLVLRATPTEAALWDNVDLGMPLAAFLQAYPAARATADTSAGGTQLPYVSYRLVGQKFRSFADCELEFSFTGAERVLYRMQVRCPADPQEVHRYLTAQYGAPTRVSNTAIAWQKAGIEVTFVPKSAVFTIADMERSKSVAASLMRLLGRVPVGDPAGGGSQAAPTESGTSGEGRR